MKFYSLLEKQWHKHLAHKSQVVLQNAALPIPLSAINPNFNTDLFIYGWLAGKLSRSVGIALESAAVLFNAYGNKLQYSLTHCFSKSSDFLICSR